MPSTTAQGIESAFVDISRQDELKTYLNSHPELANILPAIISQARQEFGPEAKLTLAVQRDPEIEDPYLQMSIRLPHYDDDFMPRLDAVTALFDDQLSGSTGYLLLTSDFRPA